jgi:hypothetical protein
MTTRRTLFQLSAGAATGVLLTPAPWHLIRDTALLSENWPGIPIPARGEIRTKATNCALCPAGCPIKVRCVGEQPVSIAGAGCAFGVGAHHLPYHPARLRQGPVAEAHAAFAARKPEDRVAILDLNPGRTASWTMRRAAAALNGLYIAPETNPVAYDLHAARTVVSVGSHLLEGWGTPANVMAARKNFRLIHAGAIESPTAMLADERIRIPAGGEEEFVARFPLKIEGPAIVIGDVPGIADLNRALKAPIYARPEAPVPDAWKKQASPITALNSVPDGAIRYLLIDEASGISYIPWHEIERKLAPNATVATFAIARGGYARHATYALPAAIFPETTEDIPPAIDQVAETFRLATPLVAPPPNVTSAAEFVAALAGVPGREALRERADAIHRSRKVPGTPDEFWKGLSEGQVWTGDRPNFPVATFANIARGDGANGLIVVPAPWTPALVSPLMTKLYEESNLRLAPNAIALNPDAARECGPRAILQTRLGRCAVNVIADTAVPRGAVLTGSSPGIRDICSRGDGAKVVRA